MPENDHDAPDRDASHRSRVSAAPPGSLPPPAIGDPARDVANEDFLFHLYRGSELLQDNRMLEAKTELEHALTLQPRDPKGQDLLAVVYFRIGLYPHAIQIYEELLRSNPRDHALRLNLALCYLKTGQAQAARVELEAVVQNNPAHRRAWGYLGLAYERLGDVDKAVHAFERGAHSQMAKRLRDRGERTTPLVNSGGVPPIENAAIRAAASAAFEELDAGELSFSLAAQEQPASVTGPWRSREPGALVAPQASVASSPSPATEPPAQSPPPSDPESPPLPAHQSPPEGSGQPASVAIPRLRHDTLEWGIPRGERAARPPTTAVSPRPIGDIARDAHLPFPDRGVALLENLALVKIAEPPSGQSFAARLEAVRAYRGDVSTKVMQRHARGQIANETFGGVGTPIILFSGTGHLVLGPRPSHHVLSFLLRDEVAFVREDCLMSFELSLEYENGRLAVGEGDTTLMVQLRGAGAVLLELLDPVAALDVTSERGAILRREVLVGWVGRLVPRALSLGESPCGQRGLVAFSGDGLLLVAAR
jgi:Flp pilus assembly protein TadD/uncharacterized protein (AIM24 family)